MPGYKSKSTHVMLELEGANTVDFILDPLITVNNGVPWSTCCDCSSSSSFIKSSLKFIPDQNWVFYLVIIFILLFLCFLLKRKAILNNLNQKHILGGGPRRPLSV